MNQRFVQIDSAKGLLIYLVVLGHLIECVKGWEATYLRNVYIAIYLFHIPAFVFFAGATSTVDSSICGKLIKLGLLLFIFNILYSTPSLLRHGVWPHHILQPNWILWFLMSLIWWQLLLSAFLKLKHPILVATFLSLMVSVFDFNGYVLSVSRTLAFLPFFIGGYFSRGWAVVFFNKRLFRRFLFVVSFVACAIIVSAVEFPVALLYGSFSFSQIGLDISVGLCLRVFILSFAALLLILFIPALPLQPSVLSRMGQSSLYIYLLHGFIIKLFGGCFTVIQQKSGDLVCAFSLICGAGIIVVGLSATPFRFAVELSVQTLKKLLCMFFKKDRFGLVLAL